MAVYTLSGWPARVLGHAAAMPQLVRLAASGAMAYKDGVTGEPGTLAVPMSGPSGVPADRTSHAMMGTFRSTSPGVPPWFRPNLYYARPERGFWPGAGMPVSLFSDNLMPVPARDPRGVPSRLSFPPPRRDNKQLQSRPQMAMWPAWNNA